MTIPSRVVVIGEPAAGGLRNSIVSALTSLGRKVEVIDWGRWHPAPLASAAFRLPRLAGGFRRDLRREVEALAGGGPTELVLVVKGAFLDAQMIEHLRRHLEAPVVCWNPDSPFDDAISNRGAGIPAAIGAYDVYVTWAEDVAERLASLSSRVVIIPFAWDPGVHHPTAGQGLAAGRIVFVGTASGERISLLRRLARFHPLVFGNGWSTIEGVEIRPAVTGPEMSAIVGEAKWNLNLLRPQNARSHNMRTFELPGAGGNQLAPATRDHERFLGADGRTLLYNSFGELEAILRSDPTSLDSRPPDLLSDHTYVKRLSDLLTTMQ